MVLSTHEREKSSVLGAIRIIINGRWLYMLALGLTGIITKALRGANANFPEWVMIALVIVSILANLYYIYVYRNGGKFTLKQLKSVCFFQLNIDALIMTIIVYFAGGIISIGFIYSVFIIVSSAFIFPLRGVVYFAAITSIWYSGLLFLQYFELMPYLSRYNHPFEEGLARNFSAVFTTVFAVVTSFSVIAFYAGLLARNNRNKEKEIIVERDKEEAIISNLADGLVFINKSGVIDMVNPTAEKMLEFKAQDVMGASTRSLDYKKFVELGKLFRRDTKTESRLIPKNRSDIELRISSTKVKGGNGDLLGTVKIIRDVSREKFVDKMKSEFIMIAGHQLRTPLSAVKSAMNSLLTGDYGPIKEEQKQVLIKSQNYTERLIQLVNDLLNVSSIEEGKFNYHFEDIDVHDLLRDVIERFLSEAEKKDMKVLLSVKNNLSKVRLDPYKIKLALGCLLSNAIGYSHESGTIKIESEFDDENVIIKVIDYGIGIPEEVRSKVFSKFFRAENALRHETEGNGLDLFIAKNIVNNHHGEIWFESEMNKGTTFYVQLPIKQKYI